MKDAKKEGDDKLEELNYSGAVISSERSIGFLNRIVIPPEHLYFTDLTKSAARPYIDELKLFQGSKVFLKDTINQTNLKIKVKEGSLLVGIVNTDRATVEVFSGGSVSIKGESSVVEIKSSTGGICSAEELSSKQTMIHASIGSVVHATASTLMEANATTGAIIRVYGSPKKLITNTRLGGSIKYIK